MSSIRSILDKLAFDAMFYGQNPEGNSKPTIDQALLEINQIIEEARPKTQENPEYICYYSYDFVQDGNLDDLSSYCFDRGTEYGEKSSADQYQSNLKEALK